MDINIINTLIKTIFLEIFTYVVCMKLINSKEISRKKIIILIVMSIFFSLIYVLTKKHTDLVVAVFVFYFLSIFLMRNLTDNSVGNFILLTTISLSMCFFLFIVATAIEYMPYYLFKIKNTFLNLIIILIIQYILIHCFFRIKRFRNGFEFLKNKNEYIDMIMITISAILIIVYCLFGNYYGDNLTIHIFSSLMLVGIFLIIMIQKSLILNYKQKLLDDTIKQYEKELKEKDSKIEELSNEKFKISKINHEFFNRQEALELKVQELSSMKMETAEEIEVTNRIQNLTKEYSNLMQSIKSMPKLPKTDIAEIDDMFKYMQAECYKNNIDFKLQVNGNIHHLINNYITKSKLETLIGDHIRDAIIAVSSSDNGNKNILAILGLKNNFYELCVYDTGIDFEIDTLVKLGLESVTTHKDEGGSGIGFITTFETMKECNASLIIEEKLKNNKNDYTKSVTIRFDGKNEYRIISYRADEIKKQTKDNRIIVEEI